MIAVEPIPATFDRWASTYSSEANPFVSLERRVLVSLLPPLQGRIVLDAGCGSGRHFKLFAERGAATVHAVDFSPQMLARAAHDPPACVHLHQARCDAIPLDPDTIDVAVCSLVLGYLPSVALFFREMRRLLRPHASLILTDIHPDTALRRKWHRSFVHSGEDHAIQWNRCSLHTIREEAQRAGFHISCDLAFPFASPECEIFTAAGREVVFAEIHHEPALYALVLRPAVIPTSLELSSARCATSAYDAPPSNLLIDGDRIAGLRTMSSSTPDNTLDLSGYLLLPGLVNAHDHLEFSLFPQLGEGPYDDATRWAADIHQRFAAEIAPHRSIPRDTRVRFGALRNLLCGVTTVCHHNPVTDYMLDSDFPVSVVDAFRWAHSPGFDLAGLRQEAAIDCPESPFILHAGEGISERAWEELQTVRGLGLLRPSTLIVHGLAADCSFVRECLAKSIGFIVCPSSNHTLYAATPDRAFVASYPFLTLGSDSPLTACGDLLDEIRFTAQHYKLTSRRLYGLLMENAPRLLQLRKGEGTLMPGACADAIAIPDRRLFPAEALRQLGWEDVHLVLRQGKIQLVSSELCARLPAGLLQGFTKMSVDDRVRWVSGSWSEDFLRASSVAESGVLSVGKRRVALA